MKGENRGAEVLENLRIKTVQELNEMERRRLAFEKEFQTEWDTLALDAIIVPPTVHCAFKNENQEAFSGENIYTSMFNSLDFPAGIVPVSQVRPEEEVGFEDEFNDGLTRLYKDDMKGSSGMPLCIQVAAPKWKDEVALALMKAIEEGFKEKQVIL